MSLNYRDNDQYRYYSASVQLFPWLETTLRYTDVRTKQYSSVEAFSGDQTYKDKAFDLQTPVGRELLDAAGGRWRAISAVPACLMRIHVANKAWGPFDFARSWLGISRDQRQRQKPVLLIQR
jgi:hypothetical protein